MTLAMVFILLTLAFTLILTVQSSIGTGFGALALVGAWFVFRIYRNHARSYIETNDESLVCKTAVNGEIRLPWAQITHIGLAKSEKSRMLYVYQESQDQLLTIPEDFQNFSGLVRELSQKPGFEENRLKDRKEIIRHLSNILKNP